MLTFYLTAFYVPDICVSMLKSNLINHLWTRNLEKSRLSQKKCAEYLYLCPWLNGLFDVCEMWRALYIKSVVHHKYFTKSVKKTLYNDQYTLFISYATIIFFFRIVSGSNICQMRLKLHASFPLKSEKLVIRPYCLQKKVEFKSPFAIRLLVSWHLSIEMSKK